MPLLPAVAGAPLIEMMMLPLTLRDYAMSYYFHFLAMSPLTDTPPLPLYDCFAPLRYAIRHYAIADYLLMPALFASPLYCFVTTMLILR